MKPIYIFYHMLCIRDALTRFTTAYEKIKRSGLLDRTTAMHVVLVGDAAKDIKSIINGYDKVITTIGTDPTNESDTLKLLWDTCKNSDCYVLYLHGKGVSRGYNPCISSWVEYMHYFCIEKYETCLNKLDTYDTCGVNLADRPMKHYSGNFWWATGEYIKRRIRYDANRSSNIKDARWYCEFWLLDCHNSNAISLHQSPVDHYVTVYERKQYE